MDNRDVCSAREGGQCRAEYRGGGIEDPLAFDVRVDLVPAFLEFPCIEAAVRQRTQVDAVVRGKVLRRPGRWPPREVAWRPDDRHAQVRPDAHCHHVFCQYVAHAHARVITFGHDVDEAGIRGDLDLDVGIKGAGSIACSAGIILHGLPSYFFNQNPG